MGRVLYATDGEGNWWRTEFAIQCEEEVFLYGQCQGVAGHKGIHWRYAPNGDLNWSDNDDDPQCAGCAGTTPSGHKNYRAPEEMRDLYYLANKASGEVTDPVLIQRLEDDDPPEGDDATITRPVSEDDPVYDECQRRLEDYKRDHPHYEDEA